jgi:hypothetical protein
VSWSLIWVLQRPAACYSDFRAKSVVIVFANFNAADSGRNSVAGGGVQAQTVQAPIFAD